MSSEFSQSLCSFLSPLLTQIYAKYSAASARYLIGKASAYSAASTCYDSGSSIRQLLFSLRHFVFPFSYAT
jgi:hypothetical protein